MGSLKILNHSRTSEPKAERRVPLIPIPANTTFFHITHWKAGSQWLRGILQDAFGSAIVEPIDFELQLLDRPIEPGRVYPCSYLAEPEFRTLAMPGECRQVIVLRDLRDTLVSGYFSVRETHGFLHSWMRKCRSVLTKLPKEDGLLYLLEIWLTSSALIHRSWLKAGEPMIQFEAFMSDPTHAMKTLLHDHWKLDVDDTMIETLMLQNTFATYSGGRAAGEESRSSHYRKGIAGDWRNHFTPRVTERFKELYGDLVIKGGYESDDTWQ